MACLKVGGGLYSPCDPISYRLSTTESITPGILGRPYPLDALHPFSMDSLSGFFVWFSSSLWFWKDAQSPSLPLRCIVRSL